MLWGDSKPCPAELKDTVKFHLALGILYLKANDLAGAEHSFKDALAKEPNNADAHHGLGDVFLKKNDNQHAEQEYKAGGPGSRSRIQMLTARPSQLYIQRGRRAQAKKIVTELTAKFPDFIPAYQRLARMAFDEKNFEETARLLGVILGKDASDPNGLLLRGQMYMAQNKPSDALKDFQEIQNRHPGLQVLYLTGLAQLQTGDIDNAPQRFRDALNIAPDFVDAGVQLAAIDIQGLITGIH